jgi:cell division protein FtsB
VGQAFSRLGLAVADRVDRLEADQAAELDALRAEVEELRARLAAMETGGPRSEPATPSSR